MSDLPASLEVVLAVRRIEAHFEPMGPDPYKDGEHSFLEDTVTLVEALAATQSRLAGAEAATQEVWAHAHALEARLARAEELLTELSEDLHAELQARWLLPLGNVHPVMQAKYDRDMLPVVNARAFLNAPPIKPEAGRETRE